MVEEKNDIPKVSLSNTKKEMLEAFNLLKKKFQEQAQAELKPEKIKEEKKEKKVIQIADMVASENVMKRVNDMKMELGHTLSGIADKVEEETARYNKIKEAIELKNNELKEIFEIEKDAFALAALLEAQKHKKLEFEDEMERRKMRLEEEINHTKAEWEKEKQRYFDLLKEQKKEDEKKKQREKEEYEYLFKREKELKKRELKDEIENLEKELQHKKDEFEKQIAERENDLLQRDLAVSEREKAMNDLQKRVDAFPAELESNVTKAVQEATETLKADAKRNEEFIIKGFQGEKNVLMTKIESLEKVVAEQKGQIDTLSKQLENAYGKVQDIAVKAVSGFQIQTTTATEKKPTYQGQDKS